MFEIRNCKLYGNSEFTCKELYEECTHLVDSFDLFTDELDFVSSVLQVLEIEWI